MKTSYLLIVNPVSGRGRGRNVARELADGLKNSSRAVEVVETEARGSAARLAAASVGDFDRVIAVGGDGTLNEVLQGLHATGRGSLELPELGFLPAGTANAAVPAFDLEEDPRRVAALLPEARSRPVDVGVVTSGTGERPFLLWCGAGYDAVIIDTLNRTRMGRMGLSGLLLNAPRVALDVARYPEPEIRVGIEGVEWARCGSVLVANVADLAFGGAFAASADPSDGRLDVVAVEPGGKRKLPALGLAVLASRLERAKGVRSRRAGAVSLRSEGSVPFQLDGEPAGSLPVRIRVEPGAVRLLVG